MESIMKPVTSRHASEHAVAGTESMSVSDPSRLMPYTSSISSAGKQYARSSVPDCFLSTSGNRCVSQQLVVLSRAHTRAPFTCCLPSWRIPRSSLISPSRVQPLVEWLWSSRVMLRLAQQRTFAAFAQVRFHVQLHYIRSIRVSLCAVIVGRCAHSICQACTDTSSCCIT